MRVEEGVRFTFVTVAGERREYMVEQLLAPGGDGGLSPVWALRNLQTGGLAQVSESWLTQGKLEGRAYWLAAAAEAKAA